MPGISNLKLQIKTSLLAVKTALTLLSVLLVTLGASAQEFLGPTAPPPAPQPAAAPPVAPPVSPAAVPTAEPVPTRPPPVAPPTRTIRGGRPPGATNFMAPFNPAGAGQPVPPAIPAPPTLPAIVSNPAALVPASNPAAPGAVTPFVPVMPAAPMPPPPPAAGTDPGGTNAAPPFANLLGGRGRTNVTRPGFPMAVRTNAPTLAAPASVPRMITTNVDGRPMIVDVPKALVGTNAASDAGGTNDLDTVLSEGEMAALKFQEADISQVLFIYADIARRVILRPSSLPAQKVTLDATQAKVKLNRREVLQMFDTIFSLNQISTVKQGDKFIKIVPQAQVGTEGAVFDTNAVSSLAESGTFVTRVVQLKYADPTEVMPIIQPFAKLPNSIVAVKSSQILVLRDNSENIKRMMELIEKVDIMVPFTVEPVVIPIKYALAGDMQQVLSGLSSGGGGGGSFGGSGAGSTGGRMSGGGRSMGGGMGGSSMGGMGGYGSGGMGGMGGSSGMGGMSGMNRATGMGATTGLGGAGSTPGAATGRSSFANRVGQIMRSGSMGSQGEIQIINNAKIIADERTNSLLVFADKDDLKAITNIIAKLDVVLAQVLIEALICSVSLGDDVSYGVSYLQNKTTESGNLSGIGAVNNGRFLNPGSFGSSGGTNSGVSALANGFSYFGKWGDDLNVTAWALANDNRATVLARPRILTSHAKEATMFVGQTVPYITGYYGGGGVYGGSPYSQYQQMQIGINLSVLPFINSEGLVVMDIQQRIQSMDGQVAINGNNVPITSDTDSSAYVAVRDRETVVLGGYIRDESSRSGSGVPILKDIPLLGNLFRSTSKSKKRSEQLVFIRPTVLPTPEAATLATAEERDRAPAIRRAEMEVEKSLKKDRDSLNKELRKAEKE